MHFIQRGVAHAKKINKKHAAGLPHAVTSAALTHCTSVEVYKTVIASVKCNVMYTDTT